jgi:hypothetical protein
MSGLSGFNHRPASPPYYVKNIRFSPKIIDVILLPAFDPTKISLLLLLGEKNMKMHWKVMTLDFFHVLLGYSLILKK